MCMEQALLDAEQAGWPWRGPAGELGYGTRQLWRQFGSEIHAPGRAQPVPGALLRTHALSIPEAVHSAACQTLTPRLIPDDLFLLWRNVQGCACPAQALRSVWTPPRKGRVTGVESLLMSFDDFTFTVGWESRALGGCSEPQESPGAQAPGAPQLCGERPGNPYLGVQRGGPSALVSHLASVGLAGGSPVAEGDPEPWGGQRRG